MAVERKGVERRKEERFPIEAKVAVRKRDGETIHATAVDISSSGMRVRLAERGPFAVDEEVTVEVQLQEDPDRPFSSWGAGRIAYLHEGEVGIQLFGGKFDSVAPGVLP